LEAIVLAVLVLIVGHLALRRWGDWRRKKRIWARLLRAGLFTTERTTRVNRSGVRALASTARLNRAWPSHERAQDSLLLLIRNVTKTGPVVQGSACVHYQDEIHRPVLSNTVIVGFPNQVILICACLASWSYDKTPVPAAGPTPSTLVKLDSRRSAPETNDAG